MVMGAPCGCVPPGAGYPGPRGNRSPLENRRRSSQSRTPSWRKSKKKSHGISFNWNEDISLSFNGYMYLYHIRNHNSYHLDTNAAWTRNLGRFRH